MALESISSQKRSKFPTGCVVAFLSLFVLIGVSVGVLTTALPLYRLWRAQSWPVAGCDVVSSEVVSAGENSYRADIKYRYQAEGRARTSDRYSFNGWSGGSHNDAEALVARYPVGAKIECYVDPENASGAIIDRALTPGYFLGLLPLFFFGVIPGALIVFVRRIGRPQTAPAIPAHAATMGAPASLGAYAEVQREESGEPSSFGREERFAQAGPLVLQPASSPMGKLMGVIFACLIWNGITGAATYFVYRDFSFAEHWFLALFLLIFQIVGVALIISVPYQILALANPRPTLTLNRSTLRLGESVGLEWQFSGAASRLRQLTVTLSGREEARYRRGTDTRTDTHVFRTISVVDITDSMQMARGTATLRIPSDTMHTFDSGNNRIVWTLLLNGSIARWPDVGESFEVVVESSTSGSRF